MNIMRGKSLLIIFVSIFLVLSSCFAATSSFSIVWPCEIKDKTVISVLDASSQTVEQGGTIDLEETTEYQNAFTIQVVTNSRNNVNMTYKATNFLKEGGGAYSMTLKFSYQGSDVIIATNASGGSSAFTPTSSNTQTSIVTGVTKSNPSVTKTISASVLLGNDLINAGAGDYSSTVTIIQVTE